MVTPDVSRAKVTEPEVPPPVKPVPAVTPVMSPGLGSIQAKGDLIVGSANDTYVILPVASTAGYVLSVDSATTSGLVWSAPNPGDITGVTAGTGLTGGGTSGSVTLALDTTGVTTGTYTLSTITVDAYGRITSASTGAASGETFNPLLLMGA